MGKIISVNISDKKGVRKGSVESALLVEGKGIESDAHSGPWHRQVSLLANESINKMREKGLDVGSGDFAENLTTEGIVLVELPIGTVLKVGEGIILKVTQIGKVCHNRCAIYYQAGDCVMPKEGIFTEVIKGGIIKPGDSIDVVAGVKKII